uniref:Endoplasmic reticulum vesicle transporter C-terminal domain-containing protein n=1 Tax=Fibrocapsa japonica TaxID=94617 RepID=A0A7S2UYF2_9STRA|mmetsp:Transcript_20489/g.29666  ORF Transcript_20489/g.29666 Transcript_20489/m.29666 type:complete len:325 (+) Transcript_20489:1-975(+)
MGLSQLMKSLDGFSKPMADIQEKTTAGAVVSIASLAIMALLLISEIWLYFKVDVVSHMGVSHLKEGMEQPFDVHLHITFPHMRCEDLDLRVENLKGGDAADVMKMLSSSKTLDMRQSKPNEVVLFKDEARFKMNETCTVEGSLKLPRVGGSIDIASRRKPVDIASLLSALFLNTAQLGNVPNVSHVIHELWFGDKILGGDQMAGSLPLKDACNAVDHGSGLFRYEVKIVPTTYEWLHTHRVKEHYQYSVVENFVKDSAGISSLSTLGLEISYDFSPIMVEYVEQKQSIFQFLTNLCAIMGGVFTTSSLLVGLIHKSSAVMKKLD